MGFIRPLRDLGQTFREAAEEAVGYVAAGALTEDIRKRLEDTNIRQGDESIAHTLERFYDAGQLELVEPLAARQAAPVTPAPTFQVTTPAETTEHPKAKKKPWWQFWRS